MSGASSAGAPGEICYGEGDLVLNDGRAAIELDVTNTGDRAVQVGSHFHFFEANRALTFDRAAAFGYRLDIPSGTAVRFEAGQTHHVSLVLFAGILIYQDWELSLVSVLTLPIVAWITRNLGKSARKASTRGMVETEGLSTSLAEMLDGRRIVRAYGLEEHAIARVVAGIDQRVRFLIKAIRSSAISAPAADLVGGKIGRAHV